MAPEFSTRRGARKANRRLRLGVVAPVEVVVGEGGVKSSSGSEQGAFLPSKGSKANLRRPYKKEKFILDGGTSDSLPLEYRSMMEIKRVLGLGIGLGDRVMEG